MTQLIPEMSIYFPVVTDSSELIATDEKIKALRIKKLRNLLLANATYKKETINTLVLTKKVAADLLKKVDIELKKQ
jgi:hypothetical protein